MKVPEGGLEGFPGFSCRCDISADQDLGEQGVTAELPDEKTLLLAVILYNFPMRAR